MKNIFSTIFVCFLFQSLSYAQFKSVNVNPSGTTLEKDPIILSESYQLPKSKKVGVIPNSVTLDYIHRPIEAKVFDNDSKAIQFEGTTRFDFSDQDLMDQAIEYYQELYTQMKTDDKSGLLELKRISDDLGMVHLKTIQTYLDIPIYGAELIFHSKSNTIQSMNGDYITSEDLNIDSQINFQLEQAIAFVQSDDEYQQLDADDLSLKFGQNFEQIKSELMWYAPDFDSKQIQLVWVINVHNNVADHYEYIINAKTGKVIRKLDTICKIHNHAPKDNAHAGHGCAMDGPAVAQATDLLGVNRTINTYEISGTFLLIDATKDMFGSPASLPDDPQGAIWTIDGNNTSPQSNNFDVQHIQSSNNSWTNSREGVSAHYNAEQAYEYFKNTHNRESINGSGGTIVSIVNVADENGNSMDNAFWNGYAIFYGNGAQAFKPLGRALDVAGHEMSHGVVQATANLEYYGESGALNESFADVFGAMIDRDDWQMGEDVVNIQFFPSGALRDLENPHNGASTGDFQGGWQPDHTDEQFTGSQDNNGVHINSGIPNHAYYIYATAIGKTKAERIWYRALTNYLTKSSQFVDLRNAVINAATDIHGANSNEVSEAEDAFSGVGIGAGSGSNNQNDAGTNPGEDLLLFSGENQDKLYIANLATNEFVYNPLSETPHISRPSITDDGESIVFVGQDKKIYMITIDWETGETNEQIIQNQPMWRNAVISKDGGRIATLTETQNNLISVFDFGLSAWNDFELFNPTFTEGIETGDVDYADAMEFDISGEVLLYDARNIINSSQGTEIEYWDIGFLEVWNNQADTWRLGNVSKLFSGLPEGISVGNPTYSKNSPYIIAFDYIEAGENNVLGTNSETGDVGLIHENNGLGYPSYSKTDDEIVFDVTFIQNGSAAGFDLGRKGLAANKIQGTGSVSTIAEQFRWPIWFSNGERILSNSEDLETNDAIILYPNPAGEFINVELPQAGSLGFEIVNQVGQTVKVGELSTTSNSIKLDLLNPGVYTIKLTTGDQIVSKKFIKL